MHIRKQQSDWREQDDLALRSAKEVMEDHIRLQIAGQLDEDLHRNYAPDAVLLTDAGSFRGHAAWHSHTAQLYEQGPGSTYEVTSLQVQEGYALLIWKAGSSDYVMDCAADSFVIANGKIRMQTSHARLVQADAHR